MSYAQYNLVEASDYNNLIGPANSTTSGQLHAVWSTGGGSGGYGQTALANVAQYQTVGAAEWANLVNTTANSANHQASTLASVTAPASGDTITYLANIPTNLTTIYTNRLNAASQGATTANTATNGSTWSASLTFTHTATFANADAARYFFNAGGQLKITCSHSNSVAGINALYNAVASNVGTIVFSAPSSGSITVSAVSYNGVTKIGGGAGGAGTGVSDSNKGYYGLTTGNSNVFTQVANTGPAGYLSSFIRVIAKTNGTQGTNNDNGTIITIYTVWDEVPDGLVVGSGSATTLTAVAPETSNIANTWGTITLAGSVSGS